MFLYFLSRLTATNTEQDPNGKCVKFMYNEVSTNSLARKFCPWNSIFFLLFTWRRTLLVLKNYSETF